MMNLLVRVLLDNEMAAARRKAGAVGILLLAALFLLAAVVFVFFALYLWLATMLAAWQAAAMVALGLLLIGLIFWLAGRSRLSRRAPAGRQFRAMMAPGRAPSENGDDNPSLGVVVAAAALGLIIGRVLTK
jgi:4-amino-4-deoxy-L-arabinose transferase-like glycosyltransferase